MTFDARESSIYGGQPFELYLFQTETQTWRLTSSDRTISYLGNDYTPEAIQRTATSQGLELKSGAVKVTLPKTHEIAQMFLPYIPSTPLSLVIYRGHKDEAEVVVHFTGRVTSAQFGDECVLTAVPEQEVLKRKIPAQKYQSQCNNILYDTGCGVDKELFRVTATLDTVDGDEVTATEFDAEADGHFDNGYLEKGVERRFILKHVGDTLTLLQPMAGLVAGDEVSCFPGCNRKFTGDCTIRYDNGDHFFGFDRIPKRNPFDGVEF